MSQLLNDLKMLVKLHDDYLTAKKNYSDCIRSLEIYFRGQGFSEGTKTFIVNNVAVSITVGGSKSYIISYNPISEA